MPSIVYTVRGDTLWNIAKAYGTTVNDIARYNGIVETDVIYPGQRLRILSRRRAHRNGMSSVPVIP